MPCTIAATACSSDTASGTGTVFSAGTTAWEEGNPADPRTIAAMHRHGHIGDYSDHRARTFDKRWFDDRDLVPDYPIRLAQNGQTHPVPLIIGTNSREFWWMRPTDPNGYGTADDEMTWLERAEAAQAYGGLEGFDAQAVTDLIFAEPARHLARLHARAGHPAWLYRFDVSSAQNPEPHGGATHAIQGTLIQGAVTSLIAVPIGVLTAIYLVEYGNKGPLARGLTFFVDVMTGIPSIVAGLFAIGFFTMMLGDESYQSGIVGAVALSVLMIPTVVRSSEEMLRLVPNELREASYALGVSKWLTIVKVVLPTAVAGLATGVTLAIARVMGETAPLLITMGAAKAVNFNPFEGSMSALPLFAYSSYANPGTNKDDSIAAAWTAALVLMVIVMVLNIVARLISKFFAPKTGR